MHARHRQASRAAVRRGLGRVLTFAGCVALIGAACTKEFTPRSVLADLRVLSVQGARLEAGPGETVTLTPVRLPPRGASLTSERWTFCPFSIGARAGFACAVPACEVPLAPDGSASADQVVGVSPAAVGVSVTADPGALAQQCLAQLAAQGALPPNVPSELPQKVNTIFRYSAAASDGSTREAVQLVPFYPGGAPQERNRAPAIQEVRIGDVVVQPDGTGPELGPGAELEVRVQLEPGAAQHYVDDTGATLQETLVVSFFTTAGRFDFDRSNVDLAAANGPEARVKLKHEQLGPSDTQAEVWVVATDLRGGETAEGPFKVPILP